MMPVATELSSASDMLLAIGIIITFPYFDLQTLFHIVPRQRASKGHRCFLAL